MGEKGIMGPLMGSKTAIIPGWGPKRIMNPLMVSELAIWKLGKKEVCNPAIAMATRRLAICKQSGSGTLDMIEQCRKTGLPEPEFRLDGGCFILTIHRKITQEPEQVTRQVSDKYPIETRQTGQGEELINQEITSWKGKQRGKRSIGK
jgi:predicted HTH transcriptional regulator